MAQLIRFMPDKKLMANEPWVAGFMQKGYHYPVSLEIDPTNKCPLDCPYCIWHDLRHSDAANATLTPDVLLRIVREAAEIGVRGLTWTGGGEPLSNPGTVAAIQLAHELGLKNGMFTTAVPLTKSAAEVLVDRLSWVRFHIDGATPETYGKYHLVPGKVLERVKANILYFTDLKHRTGAAVSAGIGSVAVMENIAEVPLLARLAKQLGLDFFQYKHDLTQMSDPVHLQWWKDQAIPLMRELAAELQDDTFFLQFSEGVDYTEPDSSPICHVHTLGTSITAQGNVAYCKRLRDVPEWALGNVHDSSLREIFDGAHHRLLAQQVTPQNCGIMPCPHRNANVALQALHAAGDMHLIEYNPAAIEHPEFI